MVFRGRLQECQNGVVVGEDAMTRTGSTYGMTMTAPAPEKTEVVDPVTAADVPWVTIVWNDPVNLMSYVTWVLQNHYGYSRKKSEKLMMDVHTQGRAVVANGTREAMEADTEALHGYGLWATFQKDA